MQMPQLAVCLDDLKLDVKSALDRARSMAFRAVDVGATSGAISPQELSKTGQRHLLKHLSDLGLRLSSLRGPAGGPGYTDAAAGERRLDTMRHVLRLASSLHVPVVSTTLGISPTSRNAREIDRLREVLAVLADEGDRLQVVVALETAGLAPQALFDVLRSLDCPHLAACCDSGAMLMQGDNPHRVAESLPGRIQLVRARDAVPGNIERPGHETAFGEGSLDTKAFLASLVEAGFGGDIVLTRTSGDQPFQDLAKARDAFAGLLP